MIDTQESRITTPQVGQRKPFLNTHLLGGCLAMAFCSWTTVLPAAEESSVGKELPVFHNLLVNPEFRFHPMDAKRTGGTKSESSKSVACWSTDAWGDIEVDKPARITQFKPSTAGNIVRIRPGKRFWQFTALPEIGCVSGDTLSLSVKGFQAGASALLVNLCGMRVESADGTWSPKDFKYSDQRTFACQGRGELLRDPVVEKKSNDAKGTFTLKVEGLTINSPVKESKESSAEQRNIVGVLMEFVNVSKNDDVWLWEPCLSKGGQEQGPKTPSRPLPNYALHIPRTMAKLWRGEPLHILTLGSSIDRASANPPCYLYNEDPKSPDFKKPLSERVFEADRINRLDLKEYVGWWQHYFMYTGRLRLELMRMFNYPVNKILLNCMACDGSCMGESHSGLLEYAELTRKPTPGDNGHPAGKEWKDLYPALFERQEGTGPDLVIFGHGANERIDTPNEIAQFEGAIRWFQRHYPGVEFIICMNPPSSVKIEDVKTLAEHYGIPFIPFADLIKKLRSTTCNFYALYPDGGHPQASVHYLWCQQLLQAFDAVDGSAPGVEQKQLPERLTAYTYGWEGEMTTVTAPNDRIAGNRFIVEDTVFNVWATHDTKDLLTIRIDGKESKEAGRGTPMASRDVRNSTFVHGRLNLGERHIVEILGQNARIVALDFKTCPHREFFGMGSPKWERGNAAVAKFKSDWGAPYGVETVTLAVGAAAKIEVEGTDLSVAYVDDPKGGDLVVSVDGQEKLNQPTNQPFVDSDGKSQYMENRGGVLGLPFGKHKVTLQAKGGSVKVLGLFTYDARESGQKMVAAKKAPPKKKTPTQDKKKKNAP